MSVPPPTTSLGHPAAVLPFAYPLDEFYALASRELPLIDQVPPAEVPAPYNELLVHEADMTPTLIQFHGSDIHLRVLSRHHRGDFYFREVVLLLHRDEKPVEFGAIKINLSLFPAAARRVILEERMPLGSVLGEYKIQHTSRPKAYIRLSAPDAFICEALELKTPTPLFGRRNTLFDPQQRALAEIVEILPPAPAT